MPFAMCPASDRRSAFGVESGGVLQRDATRRRRRAVAERELEHGGTATPAVHAQLVRNRRRCARHEVRALARGDPYRAQEPRRLRHTADRRIDVVLEQVHDLATVCTCDSAEAHGIDCLRRVHERDAGRRPVGRGYGVLRREVAQAVAEH